MRIMIGLVAAMLLLASCGGGEDSEVQQIASDTCALLEEAFDFDGEGETDVEALMAMQEEMDALAERAEEADFTDEEMEAAIREACPDVVESLEGLGS